MEESTLRHQPRHFDYTLSRRIEIESDILSSPNNLPDHMANCPNCGSVMMYRGVGRLRSGTDVYHYECVHSHREVFSVSITVTE